MKSKFSIAVLLLLVFTVLFSTVALADDDVTIPAGKTSAAGTSLVKADSTSAPFLELYEINPGSSIQFWIYRNGVSQVSKTYTFDSYGEQEIKYSNTGYMVKGAKYHSVWKKTTQSAGTPVYVHFAFIP